MSGGGQYRPRRGRGRGGFRNNPPENREKYLPSTLSEEPVVIDWDAKRSEWEDEKRATFGGLPPVKKMFYKEDPNVAKLTREEVAKIRHENRKISVSYKDKEVCADAPNPVRTFREAWQHFPDLLQLLVHRYEKPSPIQMQLWPVLLMGRDAVGIAQTGTGKTLAFLLPGLVNIQRQDPEPEQYAGPRMVVLAPTRELAIQIHDEVNKLNYDKIKSVCIYGKADRQKQLQGLSSGASVVVATPGRLDDLLRAKQVDLRRVSYVVFDEADRMLDMGFMHNLTFIITGIRPDRQFVMTSATWNNDIHYIAKSYLLNEILVRVGERELEATYTVSQEVVVCEEHEKFDKLMEFLKGCTGQDKGLVFVNKRLMCDPLCSKIHEQYDYKFDDDTLVPETLYGTMEQEAREAALDAFRRSACKLLICTDVAARGLDVIDATFVINYDLPRNLEEYVHRSGRTGRAGRTGRVLTFVCWKDRCLVQPFIDILTRSNVPVSAELNRLAVHGNRINARKEKERGGFRRGRSSCAGESTSTSYQQRGFLQKEGDFMELNRSTIPSGEQDWFDSSRETVNTTPRPKNVEDLGAVTDTAMSTGTATPSRDNVIGCFGCDESSESELVARQTSCGATGYSRPPGNTGVTFDCRYSRGFSGSDNELARKKDPRCSGYVASQRGYRKHESNPVHLRNLESSCKLVNVTRELENVSLQTAVEESKISE